MVTRRSTRRLTRILRIGDAVKLSNDKKMEEEVTEKIEDEVSGKCDENPAKKVDE